MPKKTKNSLAYMQSRELSWLKFNERVLLEANRTEMPLLERLKFISIFTSNLDEFFMIRVGSLTDTALIDKKNAELDKKSGDRKKSSSINIDSKTGMSAKEQLDEIFRAMPPLYKLCDQAYYSVMDGLARQGIKQMKMQDLDPVELKSMQKYFMYTVMPLLSPQIIDTKHPFPHLVNKQLHIAVTVEKKKGTVFGLIAMPPGLDRLIPLDGDDYRFVLLEDLLLHFAELAFGTYKVVEKNAIAVTRNADFSTEEELLDEDIDFRQHMKTLVKKRQRLSPVRLELVHPASPEMLVFLCGKLFLTPAQVFYSTAPFDVSFCFTLERMISKEKLGKLLWPVHVPAKTFATGKNDSMLKLASSKDMLFSFPFESMTPFLSLVREAADDASVLSIKITLYRIDAQSKLVESLLHAAENGKEVIVLMELRARFDESNNIEWANRLEEAGCRVIYGLVGYKVHSKICLITRKESGKLHFITQVGTGNYNEKTAKLYTDLSLVTSNPEIGLDASAFFNNMLLGNLEGEYKHLWVAPNSFKSNVIAHIEEERRKAQSGGHGRIIIKCNSLTDKEIIENLAEASQCGVTVTMNIRGICCLIPQIPGFTDNISVVSIVGKFLEHTRIFCFGEGEDMKIYISSADFMTRNTVRRVEVACPILDDDIKQKVLWMLDVMLHDDTNAWDLFSDGRYILRSVENTDEPKNSQEIFTLEAQSRIARSTSDKVTQNKDNSPSLRLDRIFSGVTRLFKRK